VNYYKRHLGDFARDCPNLSQGAVGAYTLLLDFYYANEAPLPLDRDELIRVARAFTPADRKNLDAALRLFERTADGYRSKRADEEIAAFQARAAINRELGKLGGRAKKANRTESDSLSESLANSEAKENPSQNPESNSHREASKPSAYSSADAACPHAEIVALYHELLPASPRMKVWDGTRQANLRARWREDSKRQSLDYWRRFFAHVAASPFLTGQVTSGDRKPFFAALDWLVKPENFAKVIEGRYHDRSNA
jgi:uncharacterized protein YdaU (DUF1376 family)